MYCSLVVVRTLDRFCSIFAICLSAVRWYSTHQSQSSSRVLSRYTVNEHVSLRCNYSWVDESKEEEATDQGGQGQVGHIWVFPLVVSSFQSRHAPL